MSIKLNTTLCFMILFLSASFANADGGLIFLEKNLQSQQEMKANVEHDIKHSNTKHKCKSSG
ncbi:hypothetical protein MMO38_08465 [Acinetobacter sp. NIPH 1852]|uniref:hypothetical protein n=1 Tax=unclassified Acinetobacter TaxID=196816 RepID=UPI0002CDF2C8|nr:MULTISPECIES: hypothetical protein [unclassified Acinetobacter]ENU29049.1 hypothetical protein F991_03177 [Acinetobacter sp. CIP-A165]MCH7308173.1 hypothetical protein [Acinetobacter sp. NIPH 1852]